MTCEGRSICLSARRVGQEVWISDPEVDAVYVATPVGSHEKIGQAVAAAGKPAYLEKPMARHAPECERLVKAFQGAGVPLFVAYYRRRLPRFLRVQELAQGAVGRLTALRYH